MVHNPVVKIAAAKSEPRFAQDPGVAQALLTVRQVSSSEAEQLCQWGCTPFTSLKSHDRKVDRAATHVNHQQFGARAQTGAKGGGRGLIDQRHFLNGKCFAGLQEPLPVASVVLNRRGQHQPFDADLLG